MDQFPWSMTRDFLLLMGSKNGYGVWHWSITRIREYKKWLQLVLSYYPLSGLEVYKNIESSEVFINKIKSSTCCLDIAGSDMEEKKDGVSTMILTDPRYLEEHHVDYLQLPWLQLMVLMIMIFFLNNMWWGQPLMTVKMLKALWDNSKENPIDGSLLLRLIVVKSLIAWIPSYKQPFLNNPFLENHINKMRPSSFPEFFRSLFQFCFHVTRCPSPF